MKDKQLETTRKLASVRLVNAVHEIRLKSDNELAESIQLVTVDGWNVVTKRGEYKVGDKAIYIEIDSIVDKENPYFKFLEDKKYKVKTMKLGKFYTEINGVKQDVISQGLVVPLELVNGDVAVGQDLTSELKITKIEDETKENKPQRVKLDTSQQFYNNHKRFFKTRFGKFLWNLKLFRKIVKLFTAKTIRSKRFPEFIVKTDETRIQNKPWILKESAGVPFIVSEKLDGTSTTFALEKQGKHKEFIVCSRNVRQLSRKQLTWYKDAGINYYWEMENKYNIEAVLGKIWDILEPKKTLVLQGETIGEAIQSNKYKLKGRKFYAFNIVVDGERLGSVYSQELIDRAQDSLGIKVVDRFKWVPILDTNFILPATVDELVSFATANSVLHETLREGLVIRGVDGKESFKVISPEFLLKHKL